MYAFYKIHRAISKEEAEKIRELSSKIETNSKKKFNPVYFEVYKNETQLEIGKECAGIFDKGKYIPLTPENRKIIKEIEDVLLQTKT